MTDPSISPNSRKVTDDDLKKIQLSKASARELPTRDETIAACVKLGFYSENTAELLKRGETFQTP